VKLLLFDQNLSPRLVVRLGDLYPGSTHVDSLGLGSASDREIWDFAHANGYIIVTKDADFGELSILLGVPPKIIWIRRGNCSTGDIERLLRDNYEAISLFSEDTTSGILTLF
jgi:predicted nuclease of predicted toxin-antitoxin system